MPTSTATYSQADAASWCDAIETRLTALETAYEALRADKPNNALVLAVGREIAKLHNKCRDLADDATSRLSPTVGGPLYSGGIDKPRKAED